MFGLFKSVSDSVDLITHQVVHNEKGFYQLMFDIGEDVGEFITFVLGM